MLRILNCSIFSLIPFALFITFAIKWFTSSSKPQKKQLPSPSKLPIIGNLHQLGLLPHRSLHSLSKKYGPLMLLHFGNKPVLIASSASAASEIMKRHDLVFSNRPKSGIPHRLFYGSKDVAFSPYNEYWRQMRSICVLQLLSNEMVQSFQHVREEETSLMIEKIMQKCLSSSSNSLINLSNMFVTLTNDILCKVALGKKYGDEENGRKVKATLVEFVTLLGVLDIGDYIPWLAWMNRFNGLNAKVERVVKQIDRFIECVIEEHRNKAPRVTAEKTNSDFVDILLEIQKEKLFGFTIEHDSVKAVILDMFAGGTDTTHTIMEWAMAELLRHPKILKKLQNEVRQIAKGKSEITEDDLDKMQYLKAVIKEALRLHAPLPLLVARESTRDVKLMGHDISAGTLVIINAWAIGRDPMLWNNPVEFQPERFLDCDIDFRGFDFELIPFGAGRRGCPGISFASAVNELALAKLVHKFDFTLPEGIKPEDLDMSEINGIAVHKRLPLHAVATINAD